MPQFSNSDGSSIEAFTASPAVADTAPKLPPPLSILTARIGTCEIDAENDSLGRQKRHPLQL